MRILFFLNQLGGGGAERVASVLLNHLCEKHETYVAISTQKDNSYPIDSSITIIDNHITSTIPGINRVKKLIKIRQTIKQIKPDIIISFLVDMNLDVLLSNIANKTKIIVSERNTIQLNTALSWITRTIFYKRANMIVFVSKEDYSICRHKKKTVIYNPKHLASYSDYNHRSKAIITIGPQNRWHQKGFDLLVQAWSSIEKEHPDWQLEFLGVNNNEYIVNLVKSKRLTSRVSFLGWTNDIASVLRQKSIFVLASRHEGFPNSLVEAMSQGCACIAADCPTGPKEIITNNVSGLLIPTKNIDELANTLKKLISDEELRHRMSAGAVIETNRFDKNKILQQWDALIEEVAKKNDAIIPNKQNNTPTIEAK